MTFSPGSEQTVEDSRSLALLDVRGLASLFTGSEGFIPSSGFEEANPVGWGPLQTGWSSPFVAERKALRKWRNSRFVKWPH